MRSLRRPAIAVSLVSILLWRWPAAQRSLLADGGAPIGQPARDERPGPPDPCELALTPPGRGERAASALRVGGIGRRRARRFQRRRPGRPRDRRAVRRPRRHQRRRHRAGLLRVGERTHGQRRSTARHPHVRVLAGLRRSLRVGARGGRLQRRRQVRPRDRRPRVRVHRQWQQRPGPRDRGCRHRTRHRLRAQRRHARRRARPRRRLARLGRLQRRRHRRPRDRRARLRGARRRLRVFAVRPGRHQRRRGAGLLRVGQRPRASSVRSGWSRAGAIGAAPAWASATASKTATVSDRR